MRSNASKIRFTFIEPSFIGGINYRNFADPVQISSSELDRDKISKYIANYTT